MCVTVQYAQHEYVKPRRSGHKCAPEATDFAPNVNTDGYKPLVTSIQDQAGGGIITLTGTDWQSDRVNLSKEGIDMIRSEAGIRKNFDGLKIGR